MFLVIPFDFYATNVRPNDLVCGAPTMSAVAGMAHQLQRLMRSRCKLPSFVSEAFSLTLFEFDPEAGAVYFPPQKMRGAKATMATPFDTRRVNGKACLTVKVSVSKEDHSNLMRQIYNRPKTTKSLLGSELRFAGGTIEVLSIGDSPGLNLDLHLAVHWRDVVKAMTDAFPSRGMLIECKSKLLSEQALASGSTALKTMLALLHESSKERLPKTAFTTSDPKNQSSEIGKGDGSVEDGDTTALDDLLFGDFDTLSAAADAIVVSDDLGRDGSCADQDSVYLGVLLPLCVGFHQIGQPRGDQHFVEPVLSLARLRSIRSVRAELSRSPSSDAWRRHFWRWESISEHRVHRSISYELSI